MVVVVCVRACVCVVSTSYLLCGFNEPALIHPFIDSIHILCGEKSGFFRSISELIGLYGIENSLQLREETGPCTEFNRKI